MIRVGIIADDLTGAADTAVQFVRAGWETELQVRSSTGAAQAIAVTTDSRGWNPLESADAVTAAVTRLRAAKVTHLYKKIDSTLRGQLRAEVLAVVESWSPRAIAVVCPAFPAMGRTVINGHLLINGVPVTETAAAIDPVTPVVESHLPTLLDGTHVICDAGESTRQLAGRISGSGPVVVADAITDDDLQKLAAAVAWLGPDAVPVGSAGLARHIAEVWAADRPHKNESGARFADGAQEGTGPLLLPAVVIVTSLQDVARRQAETVENAGGLRFEPTPADLVGEAAWTDWASRVIQEFGHVTLALLLTAPTDRSGHLPAELIPRRLAQLAARILAKASVSGVIVTGGDGARALLDALDAWGIKLHDEIVTGVPIGTLIGGRADGLPIVTKAGGFGDTNALIQAVHSVRCRRYS